MSRSTQKLNVFFLLATALLIVVCLFKLFVQGKIYPYAFLGTMSLLASSSFLSLHSLRDRFTSQTINALLILAASNLILLISFTFYPVLLKYLWNLSFGIVFLFPMIFILQIAKQGSKKLDRIVYYHTILTTFLMEGTLLLKLSYNWVYTLLTATFLLETILLLTLLVFRLNKSKG
jgi:hypothetical protein